MTLPKEAGSTTTAVSAVHGDGSDSMTSRSRALSFGSAATRPRFDIQPLEGMPKPTTVRFSGTPRPKKGIGTWSPAASYIVTFARSEALCASATSPKASPRLRIPCSSARGRQTRPRAMNLGKYAALPGHPLRGWCHASRHRARSSPSARSARFNSRALISPCAYTSSNEWLVGSGRSRLCSRG
jgi:hypothetical protein